MYSTLILSPYSEFNNASHTSHSSSGRPRYRDHLDPRAKMPHFGSRVQMIPLSRPTKSIAMRAHARIPNCIGWIEFELLAHTAHLLHDVCRYPRGGTHDDTGGTDGPWQLDHLEKMEVTLLLPHSSDPT